MVSYAEIKERKKINGTIKVAGGTGRRGREGGTKCWEIISPELLGTEIAGLAGCWR